MLPEQILKTIKYFDIQEHCLTLLEVYKYLLAGDTKKAFTVSDILNSLEKDLADKIQTKHGFYFLAGREALAEKRLQNNFFATPRLKRAKSFLPLVRHIPFISAVALTGSEAINNSKQGSDIDLLVLTKPKRIWLGRFFLTTYFHFLGIRRHDQKISDRFCLNHYVEQGKTIDADQNIYTAIEYVSLVPYFGANEIYDFQQKNLSWIKQYLEVPQVVKHNTPRGSFFKKVVETILANFIGNFLESFVGSFQRRRIQMRENIVVAKDELSFHPGSKGQRVLSRLNF